MIYIFGGAFDPPHVGHTSIVKAILHYKNPTSIIIIPSSGRNDKSYHTSDEHRMKMLEIFITELDDDRVILDSYFLQNWKGEMITKDVDTYIREKYEEEITHIFGTDTIESMPTWDTERYAAKSIQKLFIPRTHTAESIREGAIQNFEIFTDSHIPDISSTEIRRIIPEHTTIHARFAENPKFIIPGLSKRISQYILEHRLYKPTSEKKPKILVHVCCGPDVTMPILELREEYDIVCFWYDPNIQPKSEYDRRYEAFVKICEIEDIPYIK